VSWYCRRWVKMGEELGEVKVDKNGVFTIFTRDFKTAQSTQENSGC